MDNSTSYQLMQNATSNPTARSVFTLAADAALLGLGPKARGAAVCRTFEELAAIEGMQNATLTVADFLLAATIIWSHYAAFLHKNMPPAAIDVALGMVMPKTSTLSGWEKERDAKVLGRAKTLREVAEEVSARDKVGAPSENWQASRGRAAAVWRHIANMIDVVDERSAAMKLTWSREAGFLED